jgi:hypothetical protein
MTLGADNNLTLLVMSTIGVPLYSARGLTQTLTPVSEAKPTPRRTVNGELRWLGLSQMQKYESVISCTDQQAPRFDGIWPGQAVLVNCVCELAYITSGGSAGRTVVPGTTPRTTPDGYTYYYPQIAFMVTDYNQSMDEYAHDYQWQLSLREI